MATTYYLSATNGDLGGGADFNKRLAPGTETPGAIAIETSAGASEEHFAHTDADEPGAAGITGDFGVEVNVTSGSGQMQIAIAVARVNASGVEQQRSTFTTEQQASAGLLTFALTNVNLGAWASGDRLRVIYRTRNTHAMNAQTIQIETGTTSTEITAPWTTFVSANVNVATTAAIVCQSSRDVATAAAIQIEQKVEGFDYHFRDGTPIPYFRGKADQRSFAYARHGEPFDAFVPQFTASASLDVASQAAIERTFVVDLATAAAILRQPRLDVATIAAIERPAEAITDFEPSRRSGAEYRLDVHTAVGVKIGEVTDFLELAYTREVNAPGLLTFALDGRHRLVSQLEHNGLVIVYRRNRAMGLEWTPDFWGLFRAHRRQFSDYDRFEAECPGVLTMLSWRIVAWRAGTANRSSFQNVAAETILKTLVDYNAGPNATTVNGRVRSGVVPGVAVETDLARGNTLSEECAWSNLLKRLQEIASIGGGDFDLIRTGPQAWEFRFYPGQLGTDRTATLLFAIERGNMADPEFEHDRVDEKTVAIVGGPGEGDDRTVVVRTGSDYAASNDLEVFVDGRNGKTADVLVASGDARLREARARQTFDFSVLQTPSAYYGVHYQLGDLVKAKYGSVNVTQKIVGVSVSLDRDGGENIDVEMETI